MSVISTESTGPSIRAVERAIDVLQALWSAPYQMGLTELGNATGMPKPTVKRFLSALERRGLVCREGRQYQIGVATLPLAQAFLLANGLNKAALPVLQELANSSGETASLYVRLGLHRIIVLRVEGTFPLRYSMPVGERLPLHLGAGKVLAAGMSNDDLMQLLSQLGEVRLANGQVISTEEMLQVLEMVRRQGFYVSRNERKRGAVSVAAPVLGRDRAVVAAVAVTGLTSRVSEERTEHLSVEVRQAAQAISERYWHQ